MSQQTSPSSGSVRTSTFDWKMLDTSHWRSVCDFTLTLKQGLCSAVPPDNALGSKNSHMRIAIDEAQSKKAFRHFRNLLNRAVYGNAVHRHGKRLRVIPVVEKNGDGRWHIHGAIEPPTHLGADEFDRLIRECWRRTDWGYCRIQVRPDANQEWVAYMLKTSQKSGLENWFDCIDLVCLHNPIADA